MQELRPGLWTWTAPHPERTETDDWGPDVRSYAYDAGAAVVLFDPISPPSLLDTLLEGEDVAVALTASWHRRGTDECAERFGARLVEGGAGLPAEVELRPTHHDEEVAYWLPKLGALVVGDALVAEGPLKVTREWLPPGITAEQMVAGLRPLAELPVELVLVTHGDAVVEDAHEALSRALDA